MKYFLLILLSFFILKSSFSRELSDEAVCNKIFYSNMHQVDKFINIAKERNLSCGINNKNFKATTTSKKNEKPEDRPLGNLLDSNDGIYFERLKPSKNNILKNSNALALIIGIEKYESGLGQAVFAENDSKIFKEFAINNLGINEHKIKYLSGSYADEKAILLSVKKWLRRLIKKDKSDIYIFFAGHGLATDNGKDMFLLPYDGSPELLEETSISRAKLFKDISSENPRSVTVFLDTCYSGITRNEEMLIAGRPIVIKAKEQAIPDGFTLFSAASNEQISRPLEEAKHGMFSYFLMKGMEGDADINADNKITAQELHNYVKENVTQQSSGSQTPELQGDKDRVLVQFN